MLDRLELERGQATQTAVALINAKRSRVEKLKARLDRLQDGFLDGIIERETYIPERAKLMGEKKSIEEQCFTLETLQTAWIEPFKEWLTDLKLLGTITQGDQPVRTRTLSTKIFGSNLVLGGRKALGVATEPWSILVENELSHDSVRVFDAARTHFQKHFPSK